ncbi:MAG: AMP-binding protein, partial [Polyangiaceae bacterium]|nr:AMP-binding protein [Polyangiaceae bacterium]
MLSPFDPRDENQIALDDGVHTRTFAELERRLARLGSLLRDELGVPAGGHVALLTPNRVEGVELVLASLLCGVWITPTSHHLAKDEVEYVLEDSGARVVFVDRSLLALIPAGFAGEVIDLDSLDARLEPLADRPFDADAPPGGTMIYTSGTSGRPKGVKRTPPPSLALALAAWREAGRAFGLDGSGPHLVTGPLYHAAPLLFALYDLLNGAPLIVMRRWDERAFLELVRTRRVVHTHLVPTTITRLLRLPESERPRESLGSLSLVMHGAAPITPEVKRATLDWLGPIVSEYWGATEGGIYTLASAAEWLARPGTVGRAIPAFRIFAVDDAGDALPPGAEGTLVCRHARLERPFVYHRDEAKTELAYRAPFEFTVGDLGSVDEEGYVFLGERRSN